MEPVMINLADWDKFGEGGVGQSFFHKTDDSLILKLNNDTWPLEKSETEFNISKAVAALGIPCPAVYELVTDGKRFGYTAQRVKGKKSFSRLIADDPSHLKELAAEFAVRAKELHSTPCDTATFHSATRIEKDYIDEHADFPADVKAKIDEIYSEFDQNATTCLHGDLHTGNLIVADGREYWIDLGGFAYGDPLVDLSNMYLIGYYLPVKMTEDLFHMSIRTYRRFFKEFLKCYYGPALNAAVMRRIKRAAIFRAGLCIAARPKSAPLFLPVIREQRLKFAIVSFLARFADTTI